MFLSGAQGDPLRTQRRLAPQSTKGFPAAEADFIDYRSDGGPIPIESQSIARAVIQAEGVPGRQLVGKYALGAGPIDIGDVDPTNLGMLHLLNNVLTGHTRTDNTTWQKYIFDLLQTGLAADPYLSFLNDNDVIPRHRMHDMRAGGFTLSASGPNENLRITFPVGSPEFDFHGAVTQDTGTGSSLPIFKRTSDFNQDPDATDSDLYIEIISEAAGIITWRGKVGSGGVYSSNQVGQDASVFFQMRQENDALVGRQEEHVLVRFPDSPTLTALDEFKVNKRRVRWSQTLPAEQPISSTQSLLLSANVGGSLEELRAEGGWELVYEYPTFETRLDVSGRQGGNQRRAGSPSAVLTLTRDLADLAFQQGILSAQEISAVIDARNNANIGASTRFFRFIVILPSMLMEGTTYDTEPGGENLDEPITLRAFGPSAPFNYVADGETYTTSAHLAVAVETDQILAAATV